MKCTRGKSLQKKRKRILLKKARNSFVRISPPGFEYEALSLAGSEDRPSAPSDTTKSENVKVFFMTLFGYILRFSSCTWRIGGSSRSRLGWRRRPLGVSGRRGIHEELVLVHLVDLENGKGKKL